jgi:hypothetical protein
MKKEEITRIVAEALWDTSEVSDEIIKLRYVVMKKFIMDITFPKEVQAFSISSAKEYLEDLYNERVV